MLCILINLIRHSLKYILVFMRYMKLMNKTHSQEIYIPKESTVAYKLRLIYCYDEAEVKHGAAKRSHSIELVITH